MMDFSHRGVVLVLMLRRFRGTPVEKAPGPVTFALLYKLDSHSHSLGSGVRLWKNNLDLLLLLCCIKFAHTHTYLHPHSR
jgi:hypothetical protein